MNQNTAVSKGYKTTGIYARNADKVRPRLDEIKKQGYKALLVTVPDSPYSRSSIGVGYAVVVEAKYLLDNTAKQLLASVAAHANKCSNIRAQHQAACDKEIAEEVERNARDAQWLSDNGYSATETTAV